MKKLIVLLFIPLVSFGQEWSSNWSENQISNANTVSNVSILEEIDKNTIIFINLARLYPKQFIKNELKDYNRPKGPNAEQWHPRPGPWSYSEIYKNSPYKKSLIEMLQKLKPTTALVFDSFLYNSAKCFALEQGKLGGRGHKRKNCKKNNTAECISYGMYNGKDVAMQLLIDHNVPSLGHRKICLDKKYNKIGLHTATHTKWGSLTVIELIR
tara:strand:- start:105 stop:740 length:636 start_codon:yes stop_codon:yes gene_type:complete